MSKEYTAAEINLLKKLKKLGIEFEPSDDWHGAYHVYHQNKTFPWADGEDKPYYKPDEFVWIADERDCLKWLRERCKHHVILIHEEGEAEWWVWFDEYQETQQYDKGKTPLEALLRVVLAVKDNNNDKTSL